jgi:protein-S-isoprenylcysteine O-methyltransferase Ste14
MNEAQRLAPTPWDFKLRGVVFGIIYGVGFGLGITLQYLMFGKAQPTYALLGEKWGEAGMHAAAFVPFVFSLLGSLIRLWGTAHISSDVVWSLVVTSAGLKLNGPYLYVRNPLYLGNILLAVGIGLIGPPISTSLIVIGNVAFIMRLIGVEEQYLAATYGQAYRDYCAVVPPLLPRLTPAPAAANPRRAAWADASLGELAFFSFAAFALYNALFTWMAPDGRALGLIFITALAAQALLRRIAARKPTAT